MAVNQNILKKINVILRLCYQNGMLQYLTQHYDIDSRFFLV